MPNDKPCEHCGTTEKPRSLDRFGNWLCKPCTEKEAAAEWEE